MKKKYIITQKITSWFLSVHKEKKYRISLPDTLKKNMETLSGDAIENVAVHYNFPKQLFISTISLN